MIRCRPLLLALCAVAVLAAAPAAVRAASGGTGLPLPRFVSLRAGEVNMRAGPGVQYPVEWVFRRRSMPLEVINEYRHWRKVRDWQGDEGWVHKSMLTGRRTAMVTVDGSPVRAADSADAAVVARLQMGVILTLDTCAPLRGRCRVRVRDVEGWVQRGNLWGVHPGEALE